MGAARPAGGAALPPAQVFPNLFQSFLSKLVSNYSSKSFLVLYGIIFICLTTIEALRLENLTCRGVGAGYDILEINNYSELRY
jgi:hypothetical protein